MAKKRKNSKRRRPTVKTSPKPKVILSVNERLVLLSIMPRAGDILTVRIVREMVNDLSFSEAEIKKLGLKVTEKGVVVPANKAVKKHTKKVLLGSVRLSIIVSELKKLESKKQLQVSHIGIWDRFVKD